MSTPPGSRGLRLGGAPTVSIVLASLGELSVLESVLQTMRPACREHGMELVVVRACSAVELHDLQERHPDVLFMPAPDHTPERQLRGFGLAAADGDIVVMTDDRRPPDPEWLRDAAALTVATPRA